MKPISLFEHKLSVSIEELQLQFRGFPPLLWADFWLNPRRLRGSDFLMRWSQGLWSETRFIEAINQSELYFAIMYGPSSVAPSHDVREYELYFERLEEAGLNQLKRPDLLAFRKTDQKHIEKIVEDLGGLAELPFIPEDEMDDLLQPALAAIECENSLWKAQQMPAYGEELRPMRRLGGKPGLPKSAVLPTVIIKEEDRERLWRWQDETNIPIHIWHAFYDVGFGLSLNKAQQLIDEGLIEPTIQTFQAPGGAVSKKAIYKFYYHYAYRVGESEEDPELTAAHIIDKNGHILPYVKFEGGRFRLHPEALQVLDELAQDR
ncbi:MAG TPA: AccI family restriction endonuclease [Chloroflexi bacterium]|nr:AccI family restriction endonuclease [Chloroflexota bacterium]